MDARAGCQVFFVLMATCEGVSVEYQLIGLLIISIAYLLMWVQQAMERVEHKKQVAQLFDLCEAWEKVFGECQKELEKSGKKNSALTDALCEHIREIEAMKATANDIDASHRNELEHLREHNKSLEATNRQLRQGHGIHQ